MSNFNLQPSLENDFVKIPVPYIDIPRFKYGPKQRGGVGQGKGQPGDAIDGEPQDGSGEAGNQPGQHQLEVDISLDELADITLVPIDPRSVRDVVENRLREWIRPLEHHADSPANLGGIHLRSVHVFTVVGDRAADLGSRDEVVHPIQTP